jgi:hypothetical protein
MSKTRVNAFCFIILMFAVVALAAPVPDTGQSKCYDNTVEITCPSPGQPFYGQDANYSINPMSYTKLDGSGNVLSDSATSWVMVKDNVTGLVWETKTNNDGVKNYNNPHDADNTYTWYDSNPATNGGDAGTEGLGTDTEDFVKALNDANYGGYSDWRMPTLKELANIVKYSISDPRPKIDTGYFTGTVSSFYCSSTTRAFNTFNAWGVNFNYGTDYNGTKNYSYYVRAVRGGQSVSFDPLVIGSFDAVDNGSIDDATASADSYTDNGDGTVTDTSTGMTWQKASSSGKTWEQALAYCEGLNLGGHTDWRLPTIKELRSLADYNRGYPAINTMYFPDTVSSFYWSSTTYAFYTSYAWGVNFNYGYDNYNGKYGSYDVRAVRGGQSGLFGDLVISPASRNVAKDAGATTFSVSNSGKGTMQWTAAVTSGGTWLSITSGASGSNSGTINCSYPTNTTISARTGTIRVTATGATGSPVDVTVTQAGTESLAASFVGSWLWIYNSGAAAWSQISSTNPENMIYSSSALYADFGASYGLYKWDGAAWTQLTTANPENMVTSDSTLYVDFAALGLYKWDGAAWSQLTSANPENMVTSGSTLYVDFAALGLYKWDGAAWAQLTTVKPENMVTSGSTLYVDFGASYGLYKWDGTSWSQLTAANPENMVSAGSTLYADFGALGLYKWDGAAWAQLTPLKPEKMVTSGSTLYVDFGASYGLYRWDGAAWSQLTTADPENMVASGSILYVDFGALGLYKWDGAAWSQLTGSNPVIMAVSN